MKVRVVIDRIEDKSLAVLEIDGMAGAFFWPVDRLPAGVHDGSVLSFTIEDNPGAEKKQRDKIRAMQEELLKRSAKT
jgi:hypothetical protein